jgi:hypothetical protein
MLQLGDQQLEELIFAERAAGLRCLCERAGRVVGGRLE